MLMLGIGGTRVSTRRGFLFARDVGLLDEIIGVP